MFEGKLLEIYICEQKGSEMLSISEVQVLKDQGIVGDRYCRTKPKDGYNNAITLIESEALQALKADYDIDLPAAHCRRSLITKDVPLNHLVGKQFKVGNVRMLGVELCEPCGSLERRTQKGVLKGLLHRGGLRAAILDDGTIAVGDSIHLKAQ